jgi:hypothetical protein
MCGPSYNPSVAADPAPHVVPPAVTQQAIALAQMLIQQQTVSPTAQPQQIQDAISNAMAAFMASGNHPPIPTAPSPPPTTARHPTPGAPTQHLPQQIAQAPTTDPLAQAQSDPIFAQPPTPDAPPPATDTPTGARDPAAATTPSPTAAPTAAELADNETPSTVPASESELRAAGLDVGYRQPDSLDNDSDLEIAVPPQEHDAGLTTDLDLSQLPHAPDGSNLALEHLSKKLSAMRDDIGAEADAIREGAAWIRTAPNRHRGVCFVSGGGQTATEDPFQCG